MAVKLMAKAQSTDSDAEAIALVEKSYQLLAGIIAAVDGEARPVTPSPRRRERRYLRDRRADRCISTLGPPNLGRDPAITYRQSTENLRPQGVGHIDLTA